MIRTDDPHTTALRLHHEPFEPDVREWRIPISGPLSGANGGFPGLSFSEIGPRLNQGTRNGA